MARFAQGLISALTNPAYTEGLFTVGQQIGAAPAKRRMQEQLATASPLERFDLAIAQLTRAGDLEKAAKLTAARDKYVADQQVRTDNRITSIVASQMLSSNLTEVPETIKYDGKELSIPSRLSGDILEEVNTLQSARDARETAVTSGELTTDYVDYITDNPRLLNENPMLAKTYAKIKDPDSTMLRTERVNGVKALIKMVDDDRAARKEAKYGDAANEVRVQQLVDRIEARGSKTWLWQGNDMADALGDMSDSERNTFIKQAALALKQKPDATDSEIIDYGMSGMRKMIPGQEQSEAITESEEALAAQNEKNIKLIMEQQDVSREEAVKILNRIRAEAARNNRMNNF
jgi:NACalpha-BTF3-like transcription factor